MGEGTLNAPPTPEPVFRRPTHQELKDEAGRLRKRFQGDFLAEMVETFRITSKNLGDEFSVARLYPGYIEEDFKTLADMLEAGIRSSG